MKRHSVFDNATLFFSIPTKGDIDPLTGFWSQPSPIIKRACGDLQPYVKTGAMQVILPEGFKLENSKMFITDLDLPTVEDSNSSFAAYTTIRNREYYIAVKYDFSDGNMDTDKIFYILAMKKLNGV